MCQAWSGQLLINGLIGQVDSTTQSICFRAIPLFVGLSWLANTIHALKAPNGIQPRMPKYKTKRRLAPPPSNSRESDPPIAFVAACANDEDQMLPVFRSNHAKMIERNVVLTGRTMRAAR